MNRVEIGKTIRTIPSTWDELTRKQLLLVSSFFNSGLTVAEFKVKLLFNFLRLKKKTERTISVEDAYFLGETLNFLLSEVRLTKSLVQSIRSKRFPWLRYHGPCDGMADCTFGEFTKAQVRFEAYSKTKDPAMLDEMVAVLFRQKRFLWFIRRHFVESSDKRVKFIDRTLADRAKTISKVNDAEKYAIMLFVSGVQTSLPERFPNVYRSKPSSSTTKAGGWDTLIISLADGKTDDQSLERVMNSNMYNVFLGLEQKSIEYFDFIKKYPPHD